MQRTDDVAHSADTPGLSLLPGVRGVARTAWDHPVEQPVHRDRVQCICRRKQLKVA